MNFRNPNANQFIKISDEQEREIQILQAKQGGTFIQAYMKSDSQIKLKVN